MDSGDSEVGGIESVVVPGSDPIGAKPASIIGGYEIDGDIGYLLSSGHGEAGDSVVGEGVRCIGCPVPSIEDCVKVSVCAVDAVGYSYSGSIRLVTANIGNAESCIDDGMGPDDADSGGSNVVGQAVLPKER